MNYQGNYESTTDGKKTHHRIIQISGGPEYDLFSLLLFQFWKGKKTPKSSMKIKNVDSKNEDKKADGDNEKKILKLPEAFYAEIDDYDITDAPKRSSTYFRFIEKSAEELVSTI